MKDQPVNLILTFISFCILKLLKEEGHKSQAFRILCMVTIVLTLIGLLAHFIQTSTDSTSKFSFKGAGTVYRRSLQNTAVSPENKHEKVTRSAKLSLTRKNLNKILDEILISLDSANETLSNSKIKQSSNKKLSKSIDTKQSHDFRVLSSFECNGSIPSAFTSYVASTFVSEYDRSYGDFTSENVSVQALPKLTNVQINCVLGQSCHTLFEYDKQRGVNSTSDMKYLRKNIFYCCPPVDNFTDLTVAECNDSTTIIAKSAFRESKKPFLLERLNS